jgi:hydrogenase large subunit
MALIPRKVVAVWDDLVDFFFEADPRFREVGEGPANFIDLGQWDDPFAYDGTFQTASTWAEQRWSTPGAIVDGRLRTTDVQRINMGVEEFVDHSFYEDWTTKGPRRSRCPRATAPAPPGPAKRPSSPRRC